MWSSGGLIEGGNEAENRARHASHQHIVASKRGRKLERIDTIAFQKMEQGEYRQAASARSEREDEVSGATIDKHDLNECTNHAVGGKRDVLVVEGCIASGGGNYVD